MKRVLRERVDALLVQRGIKTLSELHLRIQEAQPGFAWQTLSLIVNGKRYPRLDTLEAIAQGLSTTVAYLIGETANPAPDLDAGQPLPEVLTWSERLRRLSPAARAKFIQGTEAMLEAFEDRLANPQ